MFGIIEEIDGRAELLASGMLQDLNELATRDLMNRSLILLGVAGQSHLDQNNLMKEIVKHGEEPEKFSALNKDLILVTLKNALADVEVYLTREILEQRKR